MTKKQLEAAKQEAREAYIDCWIDDFEKARYRRNLDYRSTQMSINDCYEVTKQAVEEYNNYSTEHVFGILKRKKNMEGVKVCLAREGSVALYFSGTKKQMVSIKREANKMGCDECDKDGNGIRMWWD